MVRGLRKGFQRLCRGRMECRFLAIVNAGKVPETAHTKARPAGNRTDREGPHLNAKGEEGGCWMGAGLRGEGEGRLMQGQEQTQEATSAEPVAVEVRLLAEVPYFTTEATASGLRACRAP